MLLILIVNNQKDSISSSSISTQVDKRITVYLDNDNAQSEIIENFNNIDNENITHDSNKLIRVQFIIF